MANNDMKIPDPITREDLTPDVKRIDTTVISTFFKRMHEEHEFSYEEIKVFFLMPVIAERIAGLLRVAQIEMNEAVRAIAVGVPSGLEDVNDVTLAEGYDLAKEIVERAYAEVEVETGFRYSNRAAEKLGISEERLKRFADMNSITRYQK